MGKGGGSQTTQTIQKADPWAGVQPALSQLYASALQNFQQGPRQYYPGSTVAPQSGVTQIGQQGLFNRAMSGNELLPTAQGEAQRTLTGQYQLMNPATAGLLEASNRDFLGTSPDMATLRSIGGGSMLNANPYVDEMFGQASGQVGRAFTNTVMPQIASMFSGAGRFGSNQMADVMGGAQQQLGNTLDKLATDIYGQNYGQERGYQQQALGQLGTLGIAGQGLQQQALGELGTQFGRERAMQTAQLGQAPGLSQADYFDIGQLLNLGGMQEDYGQQLLNADISRWDYGQNEPAAQLQLLNQLLQGSGAYAGQNTTTTAPGPYKSPLMGAAGGALMGSQLGGLFGSGAGLAATTAAAQAGLAPAALGTMQAGASLGPWGALAGALLGLMS